METRNKRLVGVRSVVGSLSLLGAGLWGGWVQAADQVVQKAAPVVHDSMQAGSPFSSYAASIAIYTVISCFLVFTLLAGGFLVVNLGLMSKRAEDQIGGRTPSDVGILKTNIWPQVPYDVNRLPAEEDDESSTETLVLPEPGSLAVLPPPATSPSNGNGKAA